MISDVIRDALWGMQVRFLVKVIVLERANRKNSTI